MHGPGQYDNLCTFVRLKARARGAIILVLGGQFGEGFSCQAGLMDMLHLADHLDHISATIRKDFGLKPKSKD